jgi:hypothetical protein
VSWRFGIICDARIFFSDDLSSGDFFEKKVTEM